VAMRPRSSVVVASCRVGWHLMNRGTVGELGGRALTGWSSAVIDGISAEMPRSPPSRSPGPRQTSADRTPRAVAQQGQLLTS
jgi:hypothetical protein